MIKFIRFIIKSLLLLVILLAFCLVTLMILINTTNYKSKLSAFIGNNTDYTLHINGAIKCSLLPNLSLYAEDIVITHKTSTAKLLESKELHLIIKPIEYIIAKFKHNKNQDVLLKLNAAMLYGLNTQVNIESQLTIDWVPKLAINGFIQLLPFKYKNDLKAIPLNVRVSLDRHQINLFIDQQNVDLELINQIFTQNVLVSGKSDLKIKLSAPYKKLQTGLLNNLSGTINLSINNGKLHGIDIFNVLVQTETQLNSLFELLRGNIKQNIASLLSHHETMPAVIGDDYFSIFSKLTLEADLHDGIANKANLLLQHPSYSVQGAGTIDLSKNIIDYKVNANLIKIEEHDKPQVAQYIQTTPIFIKINGPTNKPNFSVNTQEYLQNGLQELQKTLLINILGVGSAVKH